ncbi:Alpha/Beta hydrolase protein [Bombardia bombarda]|uniref:Carboxylic ester hydrolase n=1 Tax=Bombardia bombarda TaxID=252184 RepID=A0AA40CBB0_9PEZI|nr:Alpha/Beta hydrolase protein [Bombardia bombarda]
MALLKHLAVGLALSGAVVNALPQMKPREDVDLTAAWVADIISNATQLEQDHQASVKRGLSCSSPSSLIVDVGYAKYQGVYSAASGLNTWKGIRYARPPTGNLRWQPPVPPASNGGAVIQATNFGPTCPQGWLTLFHVPYSPGNEDCLFLSVYAPANAHGLPVLLYIHGGGYGLGDGTQNMTDMITSNNNRFVIVSIQYRLGAFGFLSSREVRKKGVVNAGMLDQVLTMAWVKANICKFGGDPMAVTIAGESAGAGSVMYHDTAVNGNLGSLLFSQSVAASPYLPVQHSYDAAAVTAAFYNFSTSAGCPATGDVLSCLRAADTKLLQQANWDVTQQATYGFWPFTPVTDGVYITGRASAQLAAKKVNGKRLLVGSTSNEGPLFVPPNITTEADLGAWLGLEFPLLSPAQINTILAANPNSSPTNPAGPRYETNGISGLNAVNISGTANGQQQRANNIYGEAVFGCPAHWLAAAYDQPGTSLASYQYQYSVPFASHGSDLAVYFGPQSEYNVCADIVLAFRQIWGNFVVMGNPSISNAIANGAAAGAESEASNPASIWPRWSQASPKFLNLNQTGGVPYSYVTLWGSTVTQFRQPGMRNAISLAAADTWEGGRSARCDVYKALGPSIPA